MQLDNTINKQTDVLSEKKEVNYALDTRIVTITCIDGDLKMRVCDVIISPVIKRHIEDGELTININYTKDHFYNMIKEFLPKIEEYFMIPKKLTLIDIYRMSTDNFNKFIDTANIVVNDKENVIIQLNNIKHHLVIRHNTKGQLNLIVIHKKNVMNGK
jgi:hypothetical protein